tara:strand:- start:88582 stop:88917 length:336 start_codon:yes stop_codon:yes gene_type:complete
VRNKLWNDTLALFLFVVRAFVQRISIGGLEVCLGRIELHFRTLCLSGIQEIMSEHIDAERLAPASAPKEEAPAEVICSDTILKGNHEVLIQHGETIYRLRITQNGKLILCK